MNRRQALKGIVAGALAPWMYAQQRISGNVAVLDGGGPNVVAVTTADGLVLVDSGAPKRFTTSSKVLALFNTHYHLDQTGNNEMIAAAGAKIIAHARTRQWMSTDYWVPSEDRYEKARPKAALPTETFQTTGSLKAGDEQVDYGYLLLAHTSGDIYVHFKNANVLAVGDVASAAVSTRWIFCSSSPTIRRRLSPRTAPS
jgi:glyoxylase-like metal-dependent hydrolase (beta-lactamase superfamily II)